jgi:hypothetical protein
MRNTAMRTCLAVILSGAAIGTVMAAPGDAQYHRYTRYLEYSARPHSPYSPTLPAPLHGGAMTTKAAAPGDLRIST